jgi:hypothetical protein
MRADMAAAYLDYRDTAELATAVARGEAPRPSCLRMAGRRREPIWARVDLDRSIASVPKQSESFAGSAAENLAVLV